VFLTQAEERTLLGAIGKLSLEAARYKVFTARRRIASFGFGYDFGSNSLTPAPPLPAFLQELRDRVSMLSGVPSSALAQATVAEYRPGTQLGWHRDVPHFGVVAYFARRSVPHASAAVSPPT
jgi:alkylated DNA repair dioxygenase AlkB